jgi:hypothetical protein
MIVARSPKPLNHPLVFHRHFEDCPGRKLAYILSMELLPRRLIDELRELQCSPPLRQLGIGDENVGTPSL